MKHISSCLLCFIFFTVAFCTAQKMEKQLESNVACKQDADCMKYSTNSLCIDNTVESPGLCYCFKDFIPQKNKTHFECLSTPKSINDTCEKDVQCQVAFSNFAVCRNSQCHCIDGSHFFENRCYQTIRLGDTCSFNQQCLLKNGKVASCQAGKCGCEFREHPYSGIDGDSCEVSKELGEECSRDAECLNEHTRCYGTCKCQPGYTTTGDGRSCIKEAENLGAYCIEDPQCEAISNNVYCENFSCRCRNHHHVYRNKCYKNVRLNGTCTDDRECWYYHHLNTTIHCKEGICTCKTKYTDDGKNCESMGIRNQESFVVIMVGVGVLILQLINMF